LVTGIIHNKEVDITLLEARLRLEFYNKTSDLMGIIWAESKEIITPDQKIDFLANFASPDASNFTHIYAVFYETNCGSMNVIINGSNMGCFGQQENLTRVDLKTKIPIEMEK